MTINYHLYTTNYRHAVAYATLIDIVKATVYNKPSHSNGLKKLFDFIF